jgi:hypothetical protein
VISAGIDETVNGLPIVDGGARVNGLPIEAIRDGSTVFSICVSDIIGTVVVIVIVVVYQKSQTLSTVVT